MSADHQNKIDNTNTLFPFAAVVNQEKAKEALLLAVINPAVHGVLSNIGWSGRESLPVMPPDLRSWDQ
ncbi:MAG: hypothetical protein OET21_09200 [Desulfobacterales bacterium]|jgi:Mg-chelatase subunit ChlI|nr:hypothetical protein [Desulfobacterales bacterium]MDH3877431.1 hypothetical protein [Desulfobacterales bacterium]